MAPTAEKVKTRAPHAPSKGAPPRTAESAPRRAETIRTTPGPTGVREAGSQIAAAMLEAADPSTGEHSDDVELVVEELCMRLEVNGDERENILVAARLHDVGKVAIPREVLEKDGPLDEREWRLIKEHTVTGERILRSVPELIPAARLVRHSHEHFDGSGYPDGLEGDQIPLGSRIILCADAFHAIRSDRPYRKGRSTTAALEEMKRCAGTQFDPDVVGALAKSVAGAKRNRRRALPPRLAILFAMLAIGSGGAFAAERGWIPSPIPGLGPERSADAGGDSANASPAAFTEEGGLTASGAVSASTDDEDVAGTDEASGDSGDSGAGGDRAARGRGADGGRADAANAAGPGGAGAAGAQGEHGGGAQGADAGNLPGGVPGSGGSGGGSAGGGSSGGGSAGGGSSGGGSGGNPGAPGQSGSSPGQSGSTPGQSGSTPGQTPGGNPGSGGAPPGQAGTSPGQAGTTPGLSGTAPGQSGTNPGNGGVPPGQGGTPPGLNSAPGNSGNAPGQGGSGGNPHAVTP